MGLRLFRSSVKGPPRTRALAPTQYWGGEPGLGDAFVRAEYGHLHPVDVDFNNIWQLTGTRFWEREAGFTLSLRWRCLGRVNGWLKCFTSLVDESGRDLGSLTYDLVGGEPPPAEWAPGDEGYETRYLELRPGTGPRLALGPHGYEIQRRDAGRSPVRLLLGLCDPNMKMRLPVVSSSLPVGDSCTAVMLTPDTVPGAQVVFRMEPAPLETCRVVFESGLELTGYSVTRRENTVWLRLRWGAPERGGPEGVWFYGYGVAQTDAEGESPVRFDQELCLEHRPGGREFEVDILRTIEEGETQAAFLRGVVRASDGAKTVPLRASSLECHEKAHCFILPLT